MTNTLENKAKFIALYFGQEVRVWDHLPDNKCKVSHSSLSPEGVKESYLSLKPISQISDEDRKEVSGELASSIDEYGCEYTFSGLVEWGVYDADYLRSRGYALPWMGISVETLVEWEWVKLKGGSDD